MRGKSTRERIHYLTDDNCVTFKRAAEDGERWKLVERMSKPALQQEVTDKVAS